MQISAWGIRNPIPVTLLFAVLTVAGLLAYAFMPVKSSPSTSFPFVTVTVTQSGAAPAEIENQIARPIENALASVTAVKSTSSAISLGVLYTTVEFEMGTDMQQAVDDVRTAVERTRAELPGGIDPPTVQRLDFDNAPVATLAVSAPRMGATELAWFIDNTVARALQAQKGVARVVRIGGARREITVALDPVRMAALDVTPVQVNFALMAFNSDHPGGVASIGGREQSIRVIGTAPDLAALRNLTIPAARQQVRLRDIAEVGDGEGEVRGFARLNGRPIVAIQISKTAEASDIDVMKRVSAELARLARERAGVSFVPIFTTADLTEADFQSTQYVLLEGIVLAIMVVYLFLRDWRATVIAATAMPMSLIPTFLFMGLMGFSLNGIPLLALTLVIGILVDDAIVEIENIEKRIERGETPYQAALIGADAIGLAVIATTATIVAVFAPVSMIQGEAGQIFREFGLTVAAAVTFSLVVARLFTPLLAAWFLTARSAGRQPAVQAGLHPLHARVLAWALARPWTSAGLGLVLFGLAMMMAMSLPIGFQATADRDMFYVAVDGAPGTARADMERAIERASAIALTEPGVDRVLAQVGSTAGGFGGGGPADSRKGTLTVVLKDDRNRISPKIQADLIGKLRAISQARFAAQSDFGLAGLQIVLAGEDGAALERAQLQLMREMRGLASVVDPRPVPMLSGPELIITPRADEAARLNVDTRAMADAIRVATIGEIDALSARYSDGGQRVPIRVRLPESARGDLSLLAGLRVPTRDGRTTTLSAVADIAFASGPGQISRRNGERFVAVEADLAVGTVIGTALSAVEALPALKTLPPGIHRASEAGIEAIAELFVGFLIALLAGIGLTYSVLVLLFRSYLKPVVIMIALPLSLFGAFALLAVFGFALDMSALIGLLMLMGLCAKNSILLVEYAIERQRDGADLRQALLDACAERTRPIVMTSVAMIAGMAPTALGIGEGSEFRQPMAIAVIGGIVTSTLLSLILVPVFYELMARFEQRLGSRLGPMGNRGIRSDPA